MSEPTSLTGTTLADALRAGELTSEACVEACLARIAARDGEVKAFEHLDPDHALAQARQADARRRSGQGVGPLNGVPVGIKDVIDTAGQPTEHGCTFYKGNQPARDAAAVAALRAAGAVILGKTVTTELATSTPPRTRNPRNLAHTPGGSSSGSAAAVADGMIPLALGTQTGGSVIRPASFCGIHGFKPTRGLISRRGVMMQSHTLDTVGVYGRSVEDLAFLADALSAHDPDDEVSYPRSQPRLLEIALQHAPVPPLLAWVETPAWAELATPVMKEAFGELIEALGDRVVRVDMISLQQAIDSQRVVQSAENGHHYGHLLKRGPDAITPGLRGRIEAGLRVSAADYLAALARREPLYAAAEEVCTHYTAILTPAAPGPAPKGYLTTGDPIFNGLWTFLGVPCVTLPLLEADGLPIGVQLVGRRQDDGRLLRTARWLDAHVEALEG
jgi:aspartyl-tRNA(Asn)/glutamyl-tRNA(Gln) amidotransferase subunit A